MDSSDEDETVETPLVTPGPKQVLNEATFNHLLGQIIRRDFYLEKAIDDSTPHPWTTMDGSMTESTTRETPSTRSNQTIDSKLFTDGLPRLNEFLDKYISEDDAYFHTLDLKNLSKYRAKHPWLFREGQSYNQKVKDQLKVPTMEKQAISGADGKVKEPITWPQNPHGHVFFPPELPHRKQSHATINYNSNRLSNCNNLSTPDHHFSPAHTPLRLFVKPNKIGIDGKLEDESSRSREEQLAANNGSQFTVQTDLTTATLPTQMNHYEREPGIAGAVAKPGQDRYYLPNASPRDDLVHRIYEEKVAEAIRTPKHKKTPGISSMTSVRSSSIFSTNSDRIRQAMLSKKERARKR